MSKVRGWNGSNMPVASKYRFSVEKRWLTMPDGTRLAATIYMPRAKHEGETFPVLLEVLPYRKDDTFYVIDYPSYSYFAQHGFISVKVDIRGTGGSQGKIPPREYSDIELADIEEVIAQLAALEDSNGNVAMWGVSWSGFNSLMIAMRRPAALKTIICMHASDDLFHDDVHYIDGILHLDSYHLFINHELALPRTPHYRLDEPYYKERFDRKPWIFTYLKNQVDGSFWRLKSLKEDYGAIQIPVYLVGGLLDGYRSAMVRICEHLDVPMRVEIGPWDHACPDDGSPGPVHEWHHKAVQWLNHWLRAEKSGIEKELQRGKEMSVFVRSGHKPDANMATTPGHWRTLPWPIEGNGRKFYLQSNGGLGSRRGKSGLRRINYNPGAGVAAGGWWGDATGDMSRDDAQGLIFDSPAMGKPLEIIGFPSVRMTVMSSAKRANWAVRLEDVAPDGSVSLVTGGIINSSQRDDRLKPTLTPAGKPYEIALSLHFTTWTFQPGHKIRLAVSNAQFPMVWPSAEPMVCSIITGSEETALTLPVTNEKMGRRLRLPKPVKKLECPDGEIIKLTDNEETSKHWTYKEGDGKTTYVVDMQSAYRIRERRFDLEGKNTYTTSDKQPWRSMYEGSTATTITSGKQRLRLETLMIVESNKKQFIVTFKRRLLRNDKVLKSREWKESIKRRFQ